jgi:hypothetical protein
VVLGLGAAFGWRLGMATVALYLLQGALGLPVFAGTPEKGIGLAYMAGPTGGYLAGFVLAAGITWPKHSSVIISAPRLAVSAAPFPVWRADDLGAIPLRALKERNAGRRLGSRRRSLLRLRQPGRRGQPQRRPHGNPAGGPAGLGPGTTVNRLCGSGMDAVLAASPRHPAGEATGARRRGRKHVPRALRHAQGRDGLFAQRRDLRHHHRLALRQSGC